MVYIVVACAVMAYVVVAYIVMAYIVMAYVVMAYIVMAGASESAEGGAQPSRPRGHEGSSQCHN